MSESLTEAPDQAAVLAAFDAARDAFLAAFAAVPDAALSYLPAGEEYALGALVLHLQGPLILYTGLLDRLAPAPTGLVDYRDSAAAYDAARASWIAARPDGGDRAGLLAGLRAAHQACRDRLAGFDEAGFDAAAPVLFPGSETPYPTSPRAVAGWVTDHYQEHIAQVGAMVRDLRAAPG
jgi:hypothetical protein